MEVLFWQRDHPLTCIESLAGKFCVIYKAMLFTKHFIGVQLRMALHFHAFGTVNVSSVVSLSLILLNCKVEEETTNETIAFSKDA